MNEKCLIHEDLQQGSDKWLALRAGLCTSSERGLYAAKKGFETYLIQKEAEKHLQVFEESFASSAMQRGTELEPLARAAFEEKQLVDVVEVGFIERPDLNAGWSPDGLVKTANIPIIDLKVAIEIKCRNAVNHYRLFKEGLDMPTYQQMQFAMAITDIETMYFIGFNPDFSDEYKLYIQEIPRSDDFSIQTIMLLKKVKLEIGK